MPAKGYRKNPHNNETTIEARIVRFFFRTVGAGLGFYSPHEKAYAEGMESEPLYQANLEIVRTALKEGWVATDLESFIIERYNAGERAALLSEILPKKAQSKRLDKGDDLLDPEGDYLHPHLYHRSLPSHAVVNGALVQMAYGSLALKERFTLGDLLDYYFASVKVANIPSAYEAALGPMRWLLNQAVLDEILFAIDRAGRDDKAVSVLNLTDYLDEAREDLFARKARRGE